MGVCEKVSGDGCITNKTNKERDQEREREKGSERERERQRGDNSIEDRKKAREGRERTMQRAKKNEVLYSVGKERERERERGRERERESGEREEEERKSVG